MEVNSDGRQLEEINDFCSNPLWEVFNSDVREERPYTFEDFKKEYFIPNL